MGKFNKLFVSNVTKVKISGFDEWFLVTHINELRTHIKLSGLAGEFQRGHIKQFTNRSI